MARRRGHGRGDPNKLDELPDNRGTQSSQQEIQGVSHNTKQEKKRKRPDDKRQNVAKKAGGGRSQQQYQWAEQDQFGNSTNSGLHQDLAQDMKGANIGKAQGNFDQDHSGGKSGASQNSVGKDRYAATQGSAAPVVGPLQYQSRGQDHSA